MANLISLDPDIGKYRNKSNGILLQLLYQKSIFPVTIILIEIVIDFLSNFIIKIVLMSKYFTYSKNVINYLSKYLIQVTSQIFSGYQQNKQFSKSCVSSPFD